MFNQSIKISDEVEIKRPENNLTVLVCEKKPKFLLRQGSYYYHLIDLTDHNVKDKNLKEYEDLAEKGFKAIELLVTDGINKSSDLFQNENRSVTDTERNADTKYIDWEERRFELVKSIVNGKLAGKDVYDISLNDAHINKIFGIANKIIEKLKSKPLNI